MIFGKRLPMVANWMALGMLVALLPHVACALITTSVQGTVYRADGGLASGTVLVSWPAFATSVNEAVAAGNRSVTIGADGWMSVSLASNVGASPVGSYYTAVYHLNDGTTSTEYWIVPSSSVANLSSVRAKVVPVAMALQSVTKQYVDTSVANGSIGVITVKGGLMNGPLTLSGDPSTDLQAATKHYVDRQGSTNVSKAGDIMTGALNTPMINGKSFAIRTLQQAVDAAGANGAVEIPGSYTGSDSFSNPNGITVTDLRTDVPVAARSVKDWGAKCDWTTDDYVSLQAALDYVSLQGHAVALTFPAGGCFTSKPLRYMCQSLYGQGSKASYLIGGPGQDVLSGMDVADHLYTGNTMCQTEPPNISGLTIYVDGSVDVTQLTNTLGASITNSDTALILAAPPTYYRSIGYVKVGQETMHYTGIVGSQLTGVERGNYGVIPVAHAAGEAINYLGDLSFAGHGSAWALNTFTTSSQHTPSVILTTALSGGVWPADTSVALVSTTGLASSGSVQIDKEFLSYTSVNGNTLNGLTHGAFGTIAVAHSSAPVVYSSYYPGALSATYAAGATALVLSSAPSSEWPLSGMVLIHGDRMAYTLSGSTLTVAPTPQPYANATLVQLADVITSGANQLTITDSPSNTPFGYADFPGYGETIGCFSLDYGTAASEYLCYTGGVPALIPNSLSQYMITYQGLQRGRNMTSATSHSSTATITSVNPWTYLPPVTVDDSLHKANYNGSIPAWNIGNCGMAFHLSDAVPANPGMGTVLHRALVTDLNIEVHNDYTGTGKNTCGILFQSWPYQVTFNHFRARFTTHGVIWAMSGQNQTAQAVNGEAGWINNSPFNIFSDVEITGQNPMMVVSGPTTLEKFNYESMANTGTVALPYAESRTPSFIASIDELGRTVGTGGTLTDFGGEVNNQIVSSPYYPVGEWDGGIAANNATLNGAWGYQPFYVRTNKSLLNIGASGLGVVFTGDSNKVQGFLGATDYGFNNTFQASAFVYGKRQSANTPQIQPLGNSTGDAFFRGYVNGNWYNSNSDMMLTPADLWSSFEPGANFPAGSTLISDTRVPLGAGKAIHVPGNSVAGSGSASPDASNSGYSLSQRINYGKGILYASLRADSGTPTMGVRVNPYSSLQSCQLSTAWSVCAVAYDASGFTSSQSSAFSFMTPSNGSGYSIGPLVFVPQIVSESVGTISADNLVASQVSSPLQVGTSASAQVAFFSATEKTQFGAAIAGCTTPGVSKLPAAWGVPGLALVDNEILEWSGAICVGDGSFHLTGLTRGLYGTVAADHAQWSQIATLPWMLVVGGSPEVLCTQTGCNFGAGNPQHTLSYGGGFYGGDTNGNWVVSTLVSSIPTGTAPFVVASTTPVANLTLANVSQLPAMASTSLTDSASLVRVASPTFTGTVTAPTLNATGTLRVNGVAFASNNLSDGSGLAKLNISNAWSSTQAFSGAGFSAPITISAVTGAAPMVIVSTTPVANLTLANVSQLPSIASTNLSDSSTLARLASPSFTGTVSAPILNASSALQVNGIALSSLNLSDASGLAKLGVGNVFTMPQTAPNFVGVIGSESDVTYLSTPTFSALANLNYLILTGNVTSSTLAAGKNGQSITFLLCQDTTGSRTFVWPSTVRGGMTIGSTASKCSSQIFTYVSALSKWVAASAGIANE